MQQADGYCTPIKSAQRSLKDTDGFWLGVGVPDRGGAPEAAIGSASQRTCAWTA